jgi:glucose/arabinose dehydrogenase
MFDRTDPDCGATPVGRLRAVEYPRPVRRLAAVAVVTVIVAASAVVGNRDAAEAAPAAGFTDVLVASVPSPTAVEALPGGRVVVLEQDSGRIRLIDTATGQLLAAPAAQLAVCGGGERGLLGFTHDPSFVSTGRVYVYYTRPAPGSPGACVNRVSAFTMSGNSIDVASEQVLVDNISSVNGNHNAGDLDVGRDGFLYVSTGDAGADPRGDSGSGGANDAAQDRSLLNGKILRLDRFTGAPAPGNPIAGPGSVACGSRGNTPATPTSWCRELFAWGLRNPYRFAFDPNSATTRFFVNDVGQGTREEVNEGAAGANYGWNSREGQCPRGQNPPCPGPPAGLTDPIVDYPRSIGTFITAGAFVPDGVWPAPFDGGYLFADGGAGRIWLRTAAGTVDYGAPLLTGAFGLADMAFVAEPVGTALYYTLNNSSQVRKLRISAALPAGRTLEFQVTGRAGVPADVSAVALNMTAVNTAGPGFATVYPCGQPRPEASNLNFVAGQNIPNLVLARPGVNGRVCVYTFATMDVLADVAGFFPAGSGFTPLVNPTRILDTRNSIGAPTAPLGAGRTLEFQVTGRAGVPADVSAVALNMTAVNTAGPGFATVYPCGQPRPEASNLNFVAGQNIPNLVLARPGVNGRVCVYTFATMDVLADVAGFFPAGSGFTPLVNPTRILDTRNSIGAPTAPLGAGRTLEFQVTGRAGVPADVSAVALNMTAVNTAGPGFATVYPCGQPRPEASNLNFVAGQNIPNLVLARPGVNGRVCVYTFATMDVLADVAGFFPAGSGFTPLVNPTRILDTRNGIGQ